ncbi:MAG TPA: hypothetical protein VFU05_02405, partial [Cyclobacteriaceae bacterium]|nr:hypothetical protein [Cyclobacteriaceae bacterium]
SSASRSYISRRSINAFAGFWNKKPKGEKPYIGDISGRKLRKKNYETPRPPAIKPTVAPYYGRKRAGDRPYKGPAAGSHISASRSGKAWRGDVAGRKIRGRNFTSKKTMEGAGQPVFPRKKSRQRVGDRPYKGSLPGGGYQSITGKMKKRTGPIPVKSPGIGANKIGTYSGNIRGGKVFNPQGANYSGNIKGGKVFNPQGANYSGNIKGRGKVFNPQGANYSGNIKGGKVFNPQGANYSGNIKGRGKVFNPQGANYSGNIKGGKVFNPQGANYSGNIKGGKIFTPQGADYSGNIKARKPLKGGGSISGQRWNNQGMPISGKAPGIGANKIGTYSGNIRGGKIFTPQGADYAGNMKAKKPLKGGGSVSGKIGNNKPIPTRVPPSGAEKVAGFPGGYRMFDLKPAMRNQGEEFTGTIKGRRKPLKGGGSVSGKIGNNNGQPIAGKTPGDAADEADRFMGKRKMKQDYVKNPNAAEESLKKVKPGKSTYLVDGLQIKIKQQDYKKKPNAAENAQLGIGPGKNSIKASEYTRAMRQTWTYKHNPNSADDALDTHEPGKAFARATDYQGNIKMRKVIFGKKGLHPDAQFVKVNKNNTPEERDMLTNFKLWWAKLFKKSDTQPDHLKEKYKKPRYDKREEGLWYD